MLEQSRPVPVRTILAVIGLVLATFVALWLFVRLARIESILVVAAFFAVVLNPVVELTRRRLHVRRGLAVAIVFIVVFGLLGAMLYAFISPLVDQGQKFADDYPRLVREAKAGKGPVGGIVKRYKLDDKLDENRQKINDQFGKIGGGAFNVAKSVAAAVAVTITVIVLALLMILYGPDMLAGALALLPPPRRRRVQAVLRDCARALTGYVFGNFLISIIAGGATFVALFILDVPFHGVLALWVGFADLIPLVGATLGAIPAVLVAFLSSPADGIAVLIFFIAYQQFENHVLQVQIMARTVQINQLVVLVSILIGVELFGLLGALLAIPAAGVIQVIVRDLWDNRRNRPKDEPTIGADEIPVSETTDVEPAEAPPTEPPSPVQTT
jgi:predicted PurR-regulated permease PerM